ncbi:MAG: RNA-directed DNA polymerase [Clostridiales bacterium]|nr:RNA-directed DNA polymerase [Clostridiales bacterium]
MIEQKFEDVFTFEALYQGHMRGRAAKRDKKPLVKFETDMLGNIYNVYRRLNDGSFKISGYSHFTVCEPKRREIQTLHYSDRVVQHVICDDVLAPYFTERAILDNAVCQKGKGSHFALRRFEDKLRKFVRTHGVNGYILKCDILKYFPTIPHEQLKRIFCSEFRDQKLKNLISHIIDSYHTAPEYLQSYGFEIDVPDPAKSGRGVPIGNQTSQIFGMFYLNEVDRFVKEKLRVKIYSRYMDDFVLVHEDKKFLQDALKLITEEVNKLGLKFNSKTQIFPLKNGVTYLGFRYFVTPSGKLIKTVKKKTKRRLRWRARLLKKACIEGLIDSERVTQSLAAFNGHLKHAKSYKIKKELWAKLLAYSNNVVVVKTNGK